MELANILDGGEEQRGVAMGVGGLGPLPIIPYCVDDTGGESTAVAPMPWYTGIDEEDMMALMLLLSLLLMLHLSKLAADVNDASVKRAVQLVGSDPATETSEGKLVSFPSSSVEARGLEFSAKIPSSSSLSRLFSSSSSSSEAVDKDNEDSGSLLRPAEAALWSAPDT